MSKWWPTPRFLMGDLKIKNHRLPKMMIVGLLGVVFLYLSVAGLVSVTTPWLARGDTVQHVDYVWRLWHGDIPKWTDGIKYPPFVALEGHKAEAASANPPLFYVIQAPFIGPLLDGGQWHRAIAVGRSINLIMGVGCIFALAWAGWVLGKSRRAVLAVATPAIGVLIYRFTRLNVDFALDALLIIFTTLSLVFDYKVLTEGLKKKYLIWLAVLSVLGMATKAPYIIFLATSMLAIVIGSYLHAQGQTRRAILRGLLAAFGLFAAAAISIGWFYYLRDYKSYGDWFNSAPPSYTGGRAVQTLADILRDKKFWQLFYGGLISSVSLSIVVTSLTIAGWLNTGWVQARQYFKDKAQLAMAGLLIIATAGVFATQIEHSIGIGSLNFRYILPAMLPVSLFIAYGLTSFKNVRGQLVTAAAVFMGGSSIGVLANGHIGNLYSATRANGIPGAVVSLLLILFVVGAICLAWSLFVLSSNHKTPAD